MKKHTLFSGVHTRVLVDDSGEYQEMGLVLTWSSSLSSASASCITNDGDGADASPRPWPSLRLDVSIHRSTAGSGSGSLGSTLAGECASGPRDERVAEIWTWPL